MKQPNEPGLARPAAMTPTPPPTPPPTAPPPPTPPPPAPSGPQGPPTVPPTGVGGRPKGGVPVGGLIAAIAVAVVAVVLAVIFFLGKNSESDKKSDAQKELKAKSSQLASAKKDLAKERQGRQGAEETGSALANLLGQGVNAVNQLKDCVDVSDQFLTDFANNTSTIDEARRADQLCNTAKDAYRQFSDIIDQIRRS